MTCLHNDSAIPLVQPSAALDPPGWNMARPHRVVALIVALWILNGFDLLMTLLAHEQGVLEEMNPVVNFLLLGGTAAVVLFKTSLVSIGSCFLYRYRHRGLALVSVSFLVFVYGYLAVHWHYCYQWYEITLGIDPPVRTL